MFRTKPPEERLVASVRSELAENVADLEGRHREYRCRLESKKQARAALENAEAETGRLHSEGVALQRGFWEAYYGNGQDTQTEIGPELKSLKRAIEEAEKSLKRARAKFEEADFDEVAEWSALIAEANTVEEEIDRQAEQFPVAKDRRDIFEDDARFRKIRNVAHRVAQGSDGVGDHAPDASAGISKVNDWREAQFCSPFGPQRASEY